MGKRTCVIVQARMGSTRLPGKVLREIGGRPLIDHVIERLKSCRKVEEIILAIPDKKDDDVLETYAEKGGLGCFRGSEDDVLARYYGAAKAFCLRRIVRVTADCPFVDPRLVDSLVDVFSKKKVDYAAIGVEGSFPRGLDAEIFDFETLEKAHFKARRDYEREHVTPYLYENAKFFEALFLEAVGKLRRPDLRLTVDTPEDLTLAREIFNGLGDRGLFYAEDIVDFLDTNPRLLSINDFVKQKKLGE